MFTQDDKNKFRKLNSDGVFRKIEDYQKVYRDTILVKDKRKNKKEIIQDKSENLVDAIKREKTEEDYKGVY